MGGHTSEMFGNRLAIGCMKYDGFPSFNTLPAISVRNFSAPPQINNNYLNPRLKFCAMFCLSFFCKFFCTDFAICHTSKLCCLAISPFSYAYVPKHAYRWPILILPPASSEDSVYDPPTPFHWNSSLLSPELMKNRSL